MVWPTLGSRKAKEQNRTVPAGVEVLSLGPADPPYNATLQAYGNRDVEFMLNAVYLSTSTNVHELFLCRNKSATD